MRAPVSLLVGSGWPYQIGQARVRFGAAPQYQGRIADPLHQLRPVIGQQRRQYCIAGVPIAHRQLDLDEFVIVESALELAAHTVTEAVAGDGYQRLQAMTYGAQLAGVRGTGRLS